MYVFPPSESDGVHENNPELDIILAPDGGLFFRLNDTSLIELSESLTVNDNNFPSSIVSFPIGLICGVVVVGLTDTWFDGSLTPTEFIAETL